MDVYLDHNSTTPLLPEVAAAMAEYQGLGHGNPASQHARGRRARQVLEDAREQVGQVLGADTTGPRPDGVIFTSGGTEANNLALFGLAGGSPAEAIVSTIEHPSVAGAAEQLERRGWRIHKLPVGLDGVVQIAKLPDLLGPRTRFVSVMLGNNETGVLQPIAEIAEICRRSAVLLHTDAVQAVGKIPVSFTHLGVSALSLSAHKFHGPVGIGALLLKHGVELSPMLFGGFQQSGYRPGTEPVALAVGLHAALTAWQREADSRTRGLAELRDRFEAGLAALVPIQVIGQASPRLPHTANIAFPGRDRQQLAIALDLAGIACSTGSACASGSSEPSSVLVAMGLEKDVVAGALRFSLGAGTTAAEIDQAIHKIAAICNPQSSSARSTKGSSTDDANGRRSE